MHFPTAELSVTVDGDELVITAERAQYEAKETDKVHAFERWAGQVRRVLHLPRTAEVAKADVKFKHGVLEIHVPKKAGVETRKKLPVSTEEGKGGVVF